MRQENYQKKQKEISHNSYAAFNTGRTNSQDGYSRAMKSTKLKAFDMNSVSNASIRENHFVNSVIEDQLKKIDQKIRRSVDISQTILEQKSQRAASR